MVDEAASYAALRAVSIDGKAIRLNGEAVFQRLVLDQGYYADGIMTAPTDETLRRDIELSMAAGFNGARLHQKVFEERFLCHADRLGYLLWGEFGDWGCRGEGPVGGEHQKPGADSVTQWLEVLERDYSHPSIVGWCPLNETWQKLGDRITVLDDVTRGMFLATKAMDTTRPVLDTSGYSHRVPEADVYDSHDYSQDPDQLAQHQAGLAAGNPYRNSAASWGMPARTAARLVGSLEWSIAYRGQPYFVSEFGGIWWNPELAAGEESWGYGGLHVSRGKRPSAALLTTECATATDRLLRRSHRCSASTALARRSTALADGLQVARRGYTSQRREPSFHLRYCLILPWPVAVDALMQGVVVISRPPFPAASGVRTLWATSATPMLRTRWGQHRHRAHGVLAAAFLGRRPHLLRRQLLQAVGTNHLP